ncbi:hypothetical protein RvY_02959 [Ramazzottius varieornatus]|uniref:Uncharacterized protein n=1 Tax=Ramazzottius varieornatus TaxID=947166 RepID=A0A1D1UWN1_RAMVA|nr:hypothetical protein RvY_02959 [Ramazzottius varieornatus]
MEPEETRSGSSSLRIVVEGWMATATSGFVRSGPLSTVNDCLDRCRAAWSLNLPRCRLVSFDLGTGVCTQLSKDAAKANLSFSRNAEAVVAGYSDKQFDSFSATHYCKMNEAGGGSTLLTLAGHTVTSANHCKDLCHLYPECDHAGFVVSRGEGWSGNCYLNLVVDFTPCNNPSVHSYATR